MKQPKDPIITRAVVDRAIEAASADGEEITIRRIWKRLGERGSYVLTAKYVREWRQARLDEALRIELSSAVLEAVKSEVLSHVKAGCGETSATLEALYADNDDLANRCHEVTAIVERMEAEVADFKSDVLVQSGKMQQVEHDRERAEGAKEAAEALLAEMGRVAARIPDLELEIERLRKELELERDTRRRLEIVAAVAQERLAHNCAGTGE